MSSVEPSKALVDLTANMPLRPKIQYTETDEKGFHEYMANPQSYLEAHGVSVKGNHINTVLSDKTSVDSAARKDEHGAISRVIIIIIVVNGDVIVIIIRR